MNSSIKGDRLEDAFHQYLLDQQNRGDLVFGTYPPSNCKIFKKKKYYCKEREADVEFDVVLEVYRQGGLSPHLYVIFECKNHNGSIQEIYVNDFSQKIGRIFEHSSKGVIVVSSRLQSGAEKVARNSGMGIVKYDKHGLDIVADRRGRSYAENSFVESQIFRSESSAKSLKFSAYYDGSFFGTMDEFLRSLDPHLHAEIKNEKAPTSIPYVPAETIKNSVREILNQIDYVGGPVNLEKICSTLSIDLQFSAQKIRDVDGTPILGSANFNHNLIRINANENRNRERFTIGHEIGHFCLKHQLYLSSETIIERDLLINNETEKSFNYERLEIQANAFSSNLILPDDFFKDKTAECRRLLDIRDRGHGYIFVDDQPCNYTVYDQLLLNLSSHFEVSKQAIQIKLKSLRMLTDQRKRHEVSPISQMLENLTSSRR
ncbi:ImmA/IrrE family metallo-endopeptidase [Rhizobium sp. LjRoot254]|uniref:ImmA/IrrE family metallo-endopeptidase n=1 Tax=Rhizobium sp. LjRoot254 TaxID=3342297 RepID=UPI003ED049F0